MKTSLSMFVLAAALALAAGCNQTTEGAEGKIAFTPDDCGRVGGCDFDDSIGVGGVVDVNIQGIDGFSTAGLDLATSDPSVLTVVAIGDVGGRPTWELTGVGAGVARIYAIDRDDAELDFIEVGVQELSGLTFENFVGDAVGPTVEAGVDEAWTVNANQNVSFYVTPVVGAGVPTMGRYEYVATIDQGIEDGLLEGADLGSGYLYFNALPDDYLVSFDDSFGHSIDVMLHVVATN